MKARTRRDLTIIPISEQDCLVVACDSCGAIGEKTGDVFKLPPRLTAKFTMRVALTEVLSSGALPVAAMNGVSCEMKPTGEETIIGIKEELKNAGITDIVLTGSTEENYTTCMTALAITVIGTAKESDLKFGQACIGDCLMLIGTPVFGSDVDLESVGYYADIRHMLPMQGVREIVPTGSKGIAYEANMLAALNNVSVDLHDTGIDYYKSAGPASCMLVLCDQAAAKEIPGMVIGTVVK